VPKYIPNPQFPVLSLQVSKGFKIGIKHSVLPLAEVEDGIEYLKESRDSQPRNFGLGFVEMTRDGKTVYAYEGGNALNHYRASLYFQPDEHTSVSVNSNYHTLDELIPIFESIFLADYDVENNVQSIPVITEKTINTDLKYVNIQPVTSSLDYNTEGIAYGSIQGLIRSPPPITFEQIAESGRLVIEKNSNGSFDMPTSSEIVRLQ